MSVVKVWTCGHCLNKAETLAYEPGLPEGWARAGDPLRVGTDDLCPACLSAWTKITRGFFSRGKLR